MLPGGRLRKNNDIGKKRYKTLRHGRSHRLKQGVRRLFRDEGGLGSVYVRGYSAAKGKGDYVGGEVILI